jgi:hypothetical protein
MLPNKVMEKHGVEKLLKKVPATIFESGGGKYLLIRLEEKRPGVPSFADEKGGQD